MKKMIKTILGFIRCIFKRVKYNKQLYIGKEVKIKNPQEVVLGKSVSIISYVDIFASKFEVGDNCDIGTRNRFDGKIKIGNNVLIGPDNYISSIDHNYENVDVPVIFSGADFSNKNGNNGVISIGDDTWIGTHCAIIGDVKIGKHCVIGANTVITKNVPDYSVVIGNPSKIIKAYNFNNNKWEKIGDINENIDAS